MSRVLLTKLQITLHLYRRNIMSRTRKRIRFIKCYIKHLSTSDDHGHLKKEGIISFFLNRYLSNKAIKFISSNCFFSIGNIIMIQVIEIPMGYDPASFF